MAAWGRRSLNLELQRVLNPPGDDAIQRFGWTFGTGDKVMQIENDYDKEVYNGDLGFVRSSRSPKPARCWSSSTDAQVAYGFGELDELVLAYATTIHKSQGSEYPAVVIPLTTQHYPMLRRNLRLHGRDPGQAARGDRRPAQGYWNRGSRRSVAPTLVEAQGVARYPTTDQGGAPVSFAIIRGSNGRRHEVDFGDAEIEVD